MEEISMNTVQGLEMQQAIAVRRPYFSAISWGAIFAGVIVGLSINLVINLLGIATGLMTVDVASGRLPGQNAPVLAAVWNVLSPVAMLQPGCLV
jgi:hypothetical protein